ncbi:MAG: hypothetical protein V1774_11020 [Candidatus Eisenbacteria bacterium]
MFRSRSLCLLSLLGLLALVFAGCSHEDGAFVGPGEPTPESRLNDSPPSMPSGLSILKATDQGFSLTWTPNREEDLAGYRFYVYDPSPYRMNSYRCTHGTALIDAATSRYVFTEDTSRGPHYFMLAAVDTDGNESNWCGPLEFVYAGPSDPCERNEIESVEPDGSGQPAGPPDEWCPGREEAEQTK